MALKSKLDLHELPSDFADIPIYRAAGNLDIYSAQELRKSLEKRTADQNIRNVIIDVSDLEYIDSSGIGVIFSNGIKLKKRGGSVILIKPQEMVVHALEITRALSQLTLHETMQDALAAVSTV
ncbi:MAG: STAS domain-containing protein [Leptospiraceae bacterium]|nr:STAS domain-containing protein [Leptospiraceae bacterium]